MIEDEYYAYITASLNSSVVKPERGSVLMSIIAPHLELSSHKDDPPEVPEGFSVLKIELPDLRLVYNAKAGKAYYCDTMFRDRLSENGAMKVRQFFKRTFKNAYRTFMDGYTESQRDDQSQAAAYTAMLRVKSGTVAFLLQYHIDIDEKLITRLTRDWYRHTERNERNRFSPVLY